MNEKLRPNPSPIQVPNWKFKENEKKLIQDLIREMQKNYVQTRKYNTFIVTEYLLNKYNLGFRYRCTIALFQADSRTKLLATNYDKSNSMRTHISTYNNHPYKVKNKISNDRIEINFDFDSSYSSLPLIEDSITVKFIQDSGEYVYNFIPLNPREFTMYIFYSTICPTSEITKETEELKDYTGAYDTKGYIREFIKTVSPFFKVVKYCDGIEGNDENFEPPTELPPDTDDQNEEQVNKTCSNIGQFGGGGTPLKDIKLFLYTNKVTKGTVTLRRPQVEVGTYATDWRPNPADVTKSVEMMLKQIESGRKGGRKNGKKRD